MAITDLLTEVGQPGSATTLSSPGKAIAASSINIGSSTNWPAVGKTVYFAIRSVNPASVSASNPSGQIAGTYTVWKGVVATNSLTNLTLVYGTDQNYSAGTNTQVFIPVDAIRWDALIQGLNTSMNNDGSLKTTAVQAAIGTGNTSAGWTAVGFTPTYASNNGNKEFTCTVATDLTSALSPGMKIQLTRGTAPPTQAMSFTAASSQYATKASPAGITFTSAFTCEAWVYVTAYPTGTNYGAIISRADGSTGGWYMLVNNAGQLRAGYGSASAFTEAVSYQSIPLNRWVHVAAVVTTATGSFTMYINGVSVPANRTTNNATALSQVSNLSVGALGAGNSGTFFNGYISEARVWSVAQSQANIQANMAISLTGSETNLVALFQGNGNFNDKTANANNLTATGGAIATQAANPYNTVEYGIVTKLAYSAPNTTLTIFTGTDYNVPNQVLSNFQYSTQRTPFGFPASRGKWVVSFIDRQNENTGSTSAGTFNPGGLNIQVPTGEWRISSKGCLYINVATAGFKTFTFQLGTATTTNGLTESQATFYFNPTGTQDQAIPFTTFLNYTAAALAPLYLQLVMQFSGTLSTAPGIRGDMEVTVIEAECAYI